MRQHLRQFVLDRDHFTCRYCQQEGGHLHVDHLWPKSQGGPDELWNLVTACRSCNLAKYDRIIPAAVHARNQVERRQADYEAAVEAALLDDLAYARLGWDA